jgi:hypothetical protein
VKIDKVKGTYNVYKVELSFGQLEAIHGALAKDHADALSDELFSEIGWFLNGNVPLPGEDKSATEREEEAEKERTDAEKEADKALEAPGHPNEAAAEVSPGPNPDISTEPKDPAAEPESITPQSSEADERVPAPPSE